MRWAWLACVLMCVSTLRCGIERAGLNPDLNAPIYGAPGIIACGDVFCEPPPCQTASCVAGECRYEVLCADTESCCQGQCVPAGCDDGDPCTTDVCGQSGCEHVADGAVCDDGNPCTDDLCSATGCDYVNNSATCDDGNFCNGVDTCEGGACDVHPGDPCLANSLICDPNLDACVGCDESVPCPEPFEIVVAACDYSDVCDEAAQQTVQITTYACNGGVCQASVQTETRNCTRNTDGDDCDDGNACTPNDVCSNGSCDGQGSLNCNAAQYDDDNPCTDEVCDPAQGCINEPNTDDCDDGNDCTEDDVCQDSVCAGTPFPDDDEEACDDGNDCTRDDLCVGGVCTAGEPEDNGEQCENADYPACDAVCFNATCIRIEPLLFCS